MARKSRAEGPAASLAALVERFTDRRVVVFGDLIADEFVYGRIARISREATLNTRSRTDDKFSG